MCVSSVISDYYQGWQPAPQQLPWPFQHQGLPQIIQSDTEVKEMLKRLIEIADRIDVKLGDRECHDEAKAAFRTQLGL